MIRGSVKGLLEECVNVLRKGGWTTGEFYANESAARRRELTQVCAVGAARLGFRRFFNIPETVSDEQLVKHPAYAEGMKLIGRAIYELDKEKYIDEIDQEESSVERLLDGDATDPDTGFPYSTQDVESGVVEWNDSGLRSAYQDPEARIIETFQRAATSASEIENEWPEPSQDLQPLNVDG